MSTPATAERGPVFISTVILYSLAYNAAGVMDNDNLANVLSALIHISIALISMIKKLAVKPIV